VRHRGVAACCLAGAGALAHGAQSAEPQGASLAQSVCTACHVVAAHQQRVPILKSVAPSFCEIANRPGSSAHSVAHFVTTTHWDESMTGYRMPDPMLTADQANAVARYVMQLRGQCSF